MRKYLSDHGVTFINNRKITAFQFKDTPLRDDIIVTGLEYEDVGENKQTGTITVDENDLVFDINGAITDSSSIGDFNTPIKENMEYAPSAALWKQATEHFYNLEIRTSSLTTVPKWMDELTVTTKNHYW